MNLHSLTHKFFLYLGTFLPNHFTHTHPLLHLLFCHSFTLTHFHHLSIHPSNPSQKQTHPFFQLNFRVFQLQRFVDNIIECIIYYPLIINSPKTIITTSESINTFINSQLLHTNPHTHHHTPPPPSNLLQFILQLFPPSFQRLQFLLSRCKLFLFTTHFRMHVAGNRLKSIYFLLSVFESFFCVTQLLVLRWNNENENKKLS